MRKRSGRLKDAGSFSLTYNLPYRFLVWGNTYMGDIGILAQKRLAAIEFCQIVKDISLTCKLFKTSRKTFYKWQSRYDRRNLSSLEDHSKTPHTRRASELSFEQEVKIKNLRKQYIRLGKKKLQILYERRHKEYVSQHHIQKVIEKCNLYYNPIQAKRIRTKKDMGKEVRKIRIHEINPKDYITEDKQFFFCTDSIVLYLHGGMKRYILTAVDYFNKIAYARVYKNKSSLSAFDFLLRLNLLVDGKIAAVLSDNGSEFAKYFEEACKRLKITHIYTRVNTPQDNSRDERFNRTLKEEFIDTDEFFEPSLAEDDLTEANKDLTKWLIKYNSYRPHQALDYKTPLEYAQETFFKVLPMWSARTILLHYPFQYAKIVK